MTRVSARVATEPVGSETVATIENVPATGRAFAGPARFEPATREIVVLDGGDPAELAEALEASAARHFVEAFSGAAPVFLTEGFAGADRGKVPAGLLKEMRKAAASPAPWAELLKRPAEEFGGADAAQARAAVRFLTWGGDGKNRAFLEVLLRELGSGKDASSATSAALAAADPAKLEADLKAYVNQLEAAP